jgi:ABC-type glycerol-3-phosphate transport system permease component
VELVADRLNYVEVWKTINYPRPLWNTIFYALTTTIGMLISCTLVAYGFALQFPLRDFLFFVLISTIFLPGGHDHPHLYLLHQDRLGRHLAAVDHPNLLCQRL